MKRSGMTGQDRHDLNNVSKILKQDDGQKGSKDFFKGMNQKSQNKGKGTSKNDG